MDTRPTASSPTPAGTRPEEFPVVFRCGDEQLVGIVHRPLQHGRTGVVTVPGGPTYRVGSHRQFVQMARDLASEGIAVLRFDPIGTGDSDGAFLDYDRIDEIDAQLRAATDALLAAAPGLQRVVLWGLCGSCCANLLYAHQDARVAGLALVNPWVRTPEGMARTQLGYYYPQRLLEPAFWRKVLGGKLSARTAAREVLATIRAALRGAMRPTPAGRENAGDALGSNATLPERMLKGLRQFRGPLLFILSGRDLTAQEFKRLVEGAASWREALAAAQVTFHTLAGADHTFSARLSHTAATGLLRDWVRSLDSDPLVGAAGKLAAVATPTTGRGAATTGESAARVR